MSISSGPIPAASNAAALASAVAVPPRSISIDGAKTSKLPGGRVRIVAAFSRIGLQPSSRALRSLARISATPPSAGEQNMYLL